MQNLYSPVQIWSSPLRGILLGPAFFWLLACTDPPDPPPTAPPDDGLPRYATAPHVLWAGLTPTDRVLAVFVDTPGGPMDQLAHDADVATFLNDRFSPVFLTPEVAPQLPAGVLFIDPDGCLRLDPGQPATPKDFIADANKVMLGSPPRKWHMEPTQWGIEVPGSHPLRLRCQSG